MSMTRPRTVFLADDHEMILPGIRMIIESRGDFEVSGQATDGLAAYEGIRDGKPDIAVLDLSIPSMSGFEIIARLRKEGTGTRFIILTSYTEDVYIREAMALKVEGYILKENASAELTAALEAVSQGLNYMAPKVMTRIMQGMASSGAEQERQNRLDSLTERESQVLRLVGQAKSGKEICAALDIGDSTMKAHKASIMRKLSVGSTGEMQLYARKNGFCLD